MNSPLYNKLIAYSNTKLSFHMPGHKFGAIADINKLNLASLDNTEVIGMDNLYDAQGVIKEATELMADFYGATHTLFLTNGSTAGILASILALCKDNEKIIVARNCHHSVWSALVLSGANPVYISPTYSEKTCLLGEITPKAIKEALQEHPDVKGVIIVSPTYEGVVSDIEAIAKIVHEYEKVLIVDEAHGAHFVIADNFPISSIRLGADIVINSMHKTLPALTQSALLHVCSDRISLSDLLTPLQMIQTSSPSYMMMGLMDYIRCYILEHEQSIKQSYIEPLIDMRKSLKELKHLRLIEDHTQSYDISKIIISTRFTSIDGYKLAEILNNEYNIMIEAALSTHIILITTLADNKKTLDIIEKTLRIIDKKITHSENNLQQHHIFNFSITQSKHLREIHYGQKEWINIKKCKGKIITNTIMLYPPGIPIICMGEILTSEHIKLIYKFKEKFQGIKLMDKKILLQVVKSD